MSPSVLCWHVIDLDIGRTLSADPRISYLWKEDSLVQQDLVHFGASHVFTMGVRHTIAIADAASGEEVIIWDVVPKHQDPCVGSTRLGNIRFSPHENMLAVTMHLVPFVGVDASNEANAAAAGEVHIYRCISGDL